MLKKILGLMAILLLLLIVFAAAAPFLFKDKLQALAKKQLNEQLNARTGFSDVSVSLFRNFPKLSVALDDFFIAGEGQFSKDTLIAAKRIDIAVNLFSLFGGSAVDVKKVLLQQPRIHAIAAKDGQVNWDIVKHDDSKPKETGSDSSFKVKLSSYKIENGDIVYEDALNGIYLSLADLNHSGSGNFTEDLFDLNTTTSITKANFTYGAIPYLVNSEIQLKALINVNTKQAKYSFQKAEAGLNALNISADGFFQLLNDSTYGMDISFKTPSNDFKDILSLVPAVYQNDFSKIETKGTAAFDGFVKGNYSPVSIPAYAVNVNIKQGYFKYPDLPQPVQDINLLLKASNVDGAPNNTVVDIPTASLKFGNDPFSFRVLYKQPYSAQYIDGEAKGKLNLNTITQFIKLAEGTKIGGEINADIAAKGNLNVVLKQQPGPFTANGLLECKNIFYASKEFPQPIKNTSATIRISNADGLPDHTIIDITNGHTEIGSDPVDFSLLLTNPASDPAFKAGIKGALALDRIKQWYSLPSGTSLAGRLDADIKVNGKKSMIDQKKYTEVQTTGDAKLKDVVVITKDYPQGLTLNNADISIQPKDISLNSVSGVFQNSRFTANGRLNNAIGYFINDEPLAGNMVVNADKVNLNQWMGQPTINDTAGKAASLPFAVPANIHFNLNASADEVQYDKVVYKQVKGLVVLNDQTVTLQNLTMQALGGSIGLNGAYSTKISKTKPAINLSYSLKNLDVEQTFKAFNTVKFLMPVGEFISGKLNSDLVLNGKLGEDMMPDLSSLAGNGALLLVEGFLSKFKPLEELASKLNIQELQKISVKDIRQYIEFVNGKVLVKPFKVRVSDIDMEIGGMHGFDQSLDYIINLKIPRAKMGNQANQLVNGLAAELTKKGLPVSLGETISLKVNMGGTISQPKIVYNLQQATASLAADLEGKVKEVVAAQKAKADTLLAETKKAARDSLDLIKKQAIKDAQELIREQLAGKKDSANAVGTGISTPKRAEEAAKGLLNNLFKKKKNPPDSTNKKD
jgi:hypothetical protein